MNQQVKMIGMLIKKYRLDQNMSQESLCKGICAVSYLSKIEKGYVNCSEEILEQLMKALGMELLVNQATIGHLENDIDLFYSYFYLHNSEGMKMAYNALKEKEIQLMHSPLAIDFMLVEAFYNQYLSYGKSDHLSEIKNQTYELLDYVTYMTSQQYYLTYYLIGHFEMIHGNNFMLAKSYFEKARKVQGDGLILEALASVNYTLGNYGEAIRLGDLAFNKLMLEGYSERAKNLCFVMAASYANGRDIENMLVYYKRILALNKNDDNNPQVGPVHYNIGSAYLAVRNYEKARFHLDKSYDYYKTSDDDMKSKFLMIQKITLAAYGQGKFLESRAYYQELKQVYKLIENSNLEPSLKMSLEWIECLCEVEGAIETESYLILLQKLYSQACKDSHHGFKTFYGDYLIEALKAQRKYKDALNVTEELYVKWKISQMS